MAVNPDEVGEKNWNRALPIALGFGNLPYQLMLSKNVKKPVPMVYFVNSMELCWWAAEQGAKNICHAHRVFQYKIQRDFHKHPNQAHNRKRVKGMAGRKNMKYWPQQLNFVIWCATTGCGISLDISLDTGMQLSSQLRVFPVPCLFYHKKNSLRDGRDSKPECFAWRPDVEPNKQ